MTRSSRRVVVVGSVNVDLLVRTPRHPLPGETVSGDSLQTGSGGKGLNQAVAAARSGTVVHMVAAVGDDAGGRAALDLLTSDGIDTTSVTVREDATTGHALVTVDAAGENSIIIVGGANASLDDSVGRLLPELDPDDVVLLQNELPATATATASRLAHRAGATVVWNAAPAPRSLDELPPEIDLLVVNEHELAAVALLLDIDAGDSDERVATMVGRRLDAVVVVTRGGAGSLVVDGDRHESVPASVVEVVDTTAAGDTFIGYLAGGLTGVGVDAVALTRAGTAAGLTVTRPGAAASIPSLDDVDRALDLVGTSAPAPPALTSPTPSRS